MGLEWRGLWTERDGQTPCFVRLYTALGLTVLLVIVVREALHGAAIDFVQFGTAFTTIMVGGGVGARVKLDTEASAT